MLGNHSPAIRNIAELYGQYPNLTTGIQVSPYDYETYQALLAGYAINGSSNIASAWKIITSFFGTSPRAKAEYRLNISKYLLSQISVVALKVPESMDLHAIFETLNGRGKPLTEFDMLKNFFLSQVGKERDSSNLTVVQNSFETMYDYFATNKRVTGYLRCQLQARHGYLPEKQFYRSVKASYKRATSRRVRNTIEAFASVEMGLYMMLLKPLRHVTEINTISKSARQKQGKRTLIDFLLDLSNYSVVHPLLLALFIRFAVSRKRISVSFLFDACKNLASFVMRIVHTRPAFQPSLYEKEFAQLAHQIYTGMCSDIRKFQRALLRLDKKGTVTNVINDEVFISLLSSNSIKHLQKAKQLLVAVENHVNPGAVRHADAVSVDHILPCSGKLRGSWTSFSESQRELYCNRLGNMCLLEASILKHELKNAPFRKKSAVYAGSALNGTQAISRCDVWSTQNIDARQRHMAVSASELWSFA